VKVGDLVRFKAIERNSERYPYKNEVGIIIRFKQYHPVVGFSQGGIQHLGRERLEVISESG